MAADRPPMLSPAVADAIVGLRGDLRVTTEVDPAQTALVVIDMQHFFVAPGAPLEVAAARDVVGNINRLADATRQSGATVVWVRMTFEPDELTERWTAFLPANGGADGAAPFREIEPGRPGNALWPELDVHDADLIVDKRRFSAFIQGSSDLQRLLDERGVDTLVITGTLTNVCCESTARDAMMLNYRVTMVDDATATLTDTAHQAALDNVAMFFGDVQTTDDVVEMFRVASRSPA